MKKLFFLISFFAIIIGMTSCDKKCEDYPAPSNLSTKNITDNSVELSWTAVAKASSYDVELIDEVSKAVVDNGNTTTASFVSTKLSESKKYLAKVTARCSKSEVSGNTAQLSFQTIAAPCNLAAPTNLTVQAFSTSATVNFDVVPKAKTYKVDIYTNTTPKVLVKSQIIDKPPVTITGLPAGTSLIVEASAGCEPGQFSSNRSSKEFKTSIIIEEDIVTLTKYSPSPNFSNSCGVVKEANASSKLNGMSTTYTEAIANNNNDDDGIHYIQVIDGAGNVLTAFRLGHCLNNGVMTYAYKENCQDTSPTKLPDYDSSAGVLYKNDVNGARVMSISFSGTGFTLSIGASNYNLLMDSEKW